MTIDLRNYRYEAQPILTQCQWELDRLMWERSALLRKIRDAAAQIDTLKQQIVAASRSARESKPGIVDVATRVRLLHWLAGLQASVATAQVGLRLLESQRPLLDAQIERLQARGEALETHKQADMADHVQERLRQAASEADREWLARASGLMQPPRDEGGFQT